MTVLDTKLTRLDRSHRVANGMLFLASATALLLLLWGWNGIQKFLDPVLGRELSWSVSLAGFFVSVFGIGYVGAPFGDEYETEGWDENTDSITTT